MSQLILSLICAELLTTPVGNCAELLIVLIGNSDLTCAEPLSKVSDNSVSAVVKRVLKEDEGAERTFNICSYLWDDDTNPSILNKSESICAELLTTPAGSKLLTCAEPLNNVSANSASQKLILY